jgi:hypothetical protein
MFKLLKEFLATRKNVAKPVPSKEQFARLLFDQDKAEGLYIADATFDTIQDYEREEHLRAAECFMDNFDRSEWPVYVLARIGK